MMTPKLRLIPQTITGTQALQVRGRTFFVPEDAQTLERDGVGYALVGTRLHAFCESGEIEVPADLKKWLTRELFGVRVR